MSFRSSSANKPSNFSWVIKGKLAGSARPENEPQLRWLRDSGIRAIVCLNRERPLNDKQVKGLGFEYLFIPVKDFSAPKQEDIEEFVKFTDVKIGQSLPVAVCCGAGIGRTGTLLAAYLVNQCAVPEEALKQIEERRGVGVESYAQREAVFEYARWIGKCPKTVWQGFVLLENLGSFDVYRNQWKELNLSTQKKDWARLVIDVLLYKKR